MMKENQATTALPTPIAPSPYYNNHPYGRDDSLKLNPGNNALSPPKTAQVFESSQKMIQLKNSIGSALTPPRGVEIVERFSQSTTSTKGTEGETSQRHTLWQSTSSEMIWSNHRTAPLSLESRKFQSPGRSQTPIIAPLKSDKTSVTATLAPSSPKNQPLILDNASVTSSPQHTHNRARNNSAGVTAGRSIPVISKSMERSERGIHHPSLNDITLPGHEIVTAISNFNIYQLPVKADTLPDSWISRSLTRSKCQHEELDEEPLNLSSSRSDKSKRRSHNRRSSQTLGSHVPELQESKADPRSSYPGARRKPLRDEPLLTLQPPLRTAPASPPLHPSPKDQDGGFAHLKSGSVDSANSVIRREGGANEDTITRNGKTIRFKKLSQEFIESLHGSRRESQELDYSSPSYLDLREGIDSDAPPPPPHGHRSSRARSMWVGGDEERGHAHTVSYSRSSTRSRRAHTTDDAHSHRPSTVGSLRVDTKSLGHQRGEGSALEEWGTPRSSASTLRSSRSVKSYKSYSNYRSMHSRANTDLYARNQYDEIGRRGAFPHRKSKSAGLFDKLRNTGIQFLTAIGLYTLPNPHAEEEGGGGGGGGLHSIKEGEPLKGGAVVSRMGGGKGRRGEEVVPTSEDFTKAIAIMSDPRQEQKNVMSAITTLLKLPDDSQILNQALEEGLVDAMFETLCRHYKNDVLVERCLLLLQNFIAQPSIAARVPEYLPISGPEVLGHTKTKFAENTPGYKACTMLLSMIHKE